jgi:hypothetical protein
MPALLPINEELPQPESLAAQKPTLWSSAPAWRKLVIGSGLLTSLAVSAPIALSGLGPVPDSRPTQQSCSLQLPSAPQHAAGRVTRFISGEDALSITRRVEAQEGAQISPAYLHLARVYIEIYQPNGSLATMAAVPEYMTVKIGDLVEINSRYRDPSLPCHFIPWVINRVVDPPSSNVRR